MFGGREGDFGLPARLQPLRSAIPLRGETAVGWRESSQGFNQQAVAVHGPRIAVVFGVRSRQIFLPFGLLLGICSSRAGLLVQFGFARRGNLARQTHRNEYKQIRVVGAAKHHKGVSQFRYLEYEKVKTNRLATAHARGRQSTFIVVAGGAIRSPLKHAIHDHKH